MLSEYEPKVKGKHQIAIRDDDIIMLVVQIKNPRGREDEDEGESEGITGEKDEEGEGCMVGVDGVVVAVVVASRCPAVASTAGARGRLASGSCVVPRAAFLQDPI